MIAIGNRMKKVMIQSNGEKLYVELCMLFTITHEGEISLYIYIIVKSHGRTTQLVIRNSHLD